MFSQERSFTDWKLTGFGDAPAFLFETVGSTHKLMKSMAASGEIEPGTLFVADSQSDGHGRHERTWDSPAGKNLYFNILIPLEDIPLTSAPQITQVAALTFAEIFKSLQDDSNALGLGNQNIGKITVKWPNDILCGKSKFCGILAEVVYTRVQSPNTSTSSVHRQSRTTNENAPRPAISMGVGINVNSDPAEYAHLNRDITTLKEICGQSVNREKLLQMLIANLERAIGQFKAFGISPWITAWKNMDKFIGTRGTIVVNNRCTDANHNSGEGAIKKTGCILDILPNGSLLFQCDDGKIEKVLSADLEI